MKIVSNLLAASILGALTWSANGALVGLINTGRDANGSSLAVGSQQPGWSITSIVPLEPALGGLTPGTAPYNTYVVEPYPDNSYTAPYAWLPQGPNDASKWISYSTPLFTGAAYARDYTYSLTFQAGLGDTFNLRWASDQSARVYLNSISSDNLLATWGDLNPLNYAPWHTWSPWLAVSGLMAGNNTLIFQVGDITQNYGNPTGLRVEFDYTLTPDAWPTVPEPSTTIAGLLLCVPFGISGIRHLRRRH